MKDKKKLILAIPSKGRLMDKTIAFFESHGLPIIKTGHERGYRGIIKTLDNVEVAFLSASEIAHNLKVGKAHLGVTGEDLIRETILDADVIIDFIKPLAFGHADVIVAVPECWLDVDTMSDLEEAATQFHAVHGRRLRVATKYKMLTRGFFAQKGVSGYRIVESLGATEGAPAAGSAEMIVDITSTGSTLKANNLRIIADGIILESEANLVATKSAHWSSQTLKLREKIEAKIFEDVA